MDWSIAILITVIAIALAVGRSTWLVDYAVFVFVLNRGLRRIIDYYVYHAFNPFSPISLTPLLIASVMAIFFLANYRRLPRWAGLIFAYLGAAAGYAFVIGFMTFKLAAVYALGEALPPLVLAGYAMVLNPSNSVRDRWIRSFSWGAIVVSVYGWYQYLTIPPWDGFWLKEVGFIGYMGIPEPTKMTVFSTMAERGPLAAFLGFSVVPMIVSPKWRTFLGWPAVVLVFSVILLTASRGGLVMALLATTIFVLVNRGAKMGQVILAVLIVGGTAWFGISRIPNTENVKSRFSTLRNIREDGSYQGRVYTMSNGLGQLARTPLGNGFGSGGLGVRINNVESISVVGDAGYFQILLIYGIIGTAFIACGLYLSWRRLVIYNEISELRTDHVLLARALMLATILCCWLGDMVTVFSVFWLALACGLALGKDRLARLQLRLERVGASTSESERPQVDFNPKPILPQGALDKEF